MDGGWRSKTNRRVNLFYYYYLKVKYLPDNMNPPFWCPSIWPEVFVKRNRGEKHKREFFYLIYFVVVVVRRLLVLYVWIFLVDLSSVVLVCSCFFSLFQRFKYTIRCSDLLLLVGSLTIFVLFFLKYFCRVSVDIRLCSGLVKSHTHDTRKNDDGNRDVFLYTNLFSGSLDCVRGRKKPRSVCARTSSPHEKYMSRLSAAAHTIPNVTDTRSIN